MMKKVVEVAFIGLMLLQLSGSRKLEDSFVDAKDDVLRDNEEERFILNEKTIEDIKNDVLDDLREKYPEMEKDMRSYNESEAFDMEEETEEESDIKEANHILSRDLEKRGLLKQLYSKQFVHIYRGHKLTTFPHIGAEYEVSFKVLPSHFHHGWQSGIHMTTGGGCCSRGQRYPAVFFNIHNGKPYVYICSDVNGNGDFYKSFFKVNVGVYTQIRISQRRCAGSYVYAVDIDGRRVFAIINNHPASYRNVHLYASDPWHLPLSGTIFDLVVSSN